MCMYVFVCVRKKSYTEKLKGGKETSGEGMEENKIRAKIEDKAELRSGAAVSVCQCVRVCEKEVMMKELEGEKETG